MLVNDRLRENGKLSVRFVRVPKLNQKQPPEIQIINFKWDGAIPKSLGREGRQQECVPQEALGRP